MLFIFWNVVVGALVASALGSAATTFLLATTFIGLALGPYAASYVSAQNDGDLSLCVFSTLWIMPIDHVVLIYALRLVPPANASVLERTSAAGEPTDPGGQYRTWPGLIQKRGLAPIAALA